jgi:hypothetical protein
MNLNVEDKVLISLDLEMFDQITGCPSKFSSGDVKVFEYVMSDFFNMLDANDIKIIIFAVGEIIERFPSIIDRAIASGHFVGWHSQSHADYSKTNVEEVFSDIEHFQNKYPDFAMIYRAPGFRLPCEDAPFAVTLHDRYGLTNFSSSFDHNPENYFLCVPKISFFNKSLCFGGTLFRLLPIFWLLRLFPQKYRIIYLHPRDLIGFYWQKNGSLKEKIIHFLSFGSGFVKIEALIRSGYVAVPRNFKPKRGFFCE